MSGDHVKVVCLRLGDGHEVIGDPRHELAHVEDVVDVADDLRKEYSYKLTQNLFVLPNCLQLRRIDAFAVKNHEIK